jgi:class 3 adenylate cyclase
MGEYYEAVGAQVAKHGATIKDYAGDGVLMLVGAPLPVPDAAAEALALAADIRVAVRAVLQGWQRADAPLGIGIGIATGPITVGALGSNSRLEYMAIGDAVNLAARFGSLAPDGEIWFDERTGSLARLTQAHASAVAQVKGIGEVRYLTYAGDYLSAAAEA